MCGQEVSDLELTRHRLEHHPDIPLTTNIYEYLGNYRTDSVTDDLTLEEAVSETESDTHDPLYECGECSQEVSTDDFKRHQSIYHPHIPLHENIYHVAAEVKPVRSI